MDSKDFDFHYVECDAKEVDRLACLLHTQSKIEVVRKAPRALDFMLRAQVDGGSVYVRRPDGDREVFIL